MLRPPRRDTTARPEAAEGTGRGGRRLTEEVVAVRLGLPRPVALTHLRLLTALGLLRTGRFAGCVRYRRDEVRIAEATRLSGKGWQPRGRDVTHRVPGR
ncbi:ArsR family transcriptional regulator [Streptomyces pimonensis]|uniref:ArsR family transcriptional regulator n=1 Tax=Streptomyces pimonensis TaxID=2860288 RepID=UPI0035275EC4